MPLSHRLTAFPYSSFHVQMWYRGFATRHLSPLHLLFYNAFVSCGSLLRVTLKRTVSHDASFLGESCDFSSDDINLMPEFDARESNRTLPLWAVRPVSESATAPRYEYFVPISCSAPNSRSPPSGHLLPCLKLILSIVLKKNGTALLEVHSSPCACATISPISTMLSISKLFPAKAGLSFLSRGFPLNRSLTEETFPKSLISPPFIHCFSSRLSLFLIFPPPVIRYSQKMSRLFSHHISPVV